MRAPEFWLEGGAASLLLWPLAAGFALAGRARRALARPRRAPVPVICVGNLVAGGAGKTPVALAIGTHLMGKGRRVHFLCRGYRGTAMGPLAVDPKRHDHRLVGDEALLLADHGPCWVARDRAAGAEAAAKAGADVVVLDDGFQNAGLVKDLSLVVVDGAYGFGNGRIIPAGPLRESVAEGLARADAVVLLGEDSHAIAARVARADLPLVRGELSPTRDSRGLRGQVVSAIAGIGRPEKFFATLEVLGCRVAARRGFSDHHRYDPDEIMRLVEEAQDLNALLVTTEKDFVRLPAEARNLVHVVRVVVAWRDPSTMARLLARPLGAA